MWMRLPRSRILKRDWLLQRVSDGLYIRLWGLVSTLQNPVLEHRTYASAAIETARSTSEADIRLLLYLKPADSSLTPNASAIASIPIDRYDAVSGTGELGCLSLPCVSKISLRPLRGLTWSIKKEVENRYFQ